MTIDCSSWESDIPADQWHRGKIVVRSGRVELVDLDTEKSESVGENYTTLSERTVVRP